MIGSWCAVVISGVAGFVAIVGVVGVAALDIPFTCNLDCLIGLIFGVVFRSMVVCWSFVDTSPVFQAIAALAFVQNSMSSFLLVTESFSCDLLQFLWHAPLML